MRTRKKFLLLAGIFGASIIGASFNFGENQASATVPGTNTLMSIDQYGLTAVASASDGGYLSHNGEFFAFSTGSGNVIPTDSNSKADVFVRNINTSTVTRASVSSSGAQANNDSIAYAISETGRFVLFRSTATNLIDGSTTSGTYSQLYLRDTLSGTTTLLSQNSAGVTANSDVVGWEVSSDGRFVLFTTTATNLGPTLTNTTANVYMLDRMDNSFTILNYKYDGSLIDATTSFTKADMSCDGSLVVFAYGNYLTTAVTNHVDVYLLDRRAGSKLTNLTASANGAAVAPTISCNGNYIGLVSSSYNLDPAITTYKQYHPYVYDRINGTFTLADKSSTGVAGSYNYDCNNLSYHCVQVSDNGIATFASQSPNLTSEASTVKQIYIKNLKTGSTELISKNSSGIAGSLPSVYPTISTDGSIVGYGSNSTNLVTASDTNSYMDGFTSLTGY